MYYFVFHRKKKVYKKVKLYTVFKYRVILINNMYYKVREGLGFS